MHPNQCVGKKKVDENLVIQPRTQETLVLMEEQEEIAQIYVLFLFNKVESSFLPRCFVLENNVHGRYIRVIEEERNLKHYR